MDKIRYLPLAVILILSLLLSSCSPGDSLYINSLTTPLSWQGDLAAAPVPAIQGMAYHNTTNGITYYYDGATWQTLATPGANGANGANGAPGAAGQGFTWQGAWVSGGSYVPYDMVESGGSAFNCILATSGVILPSLDNVHWSLVAQAGLSSVLNGVTTTDINGFIKGNGAVVSADNSTYLTTEGDPVVGAVAGIVKSNGAGVISAASSGTDYAPVTSGTSVLKANGSGGFAAAGVADIDPIVTRIIEIKLIDDATSLGTGDGKVFFCIPVDLNGWNLVDADAMVSTVSSSGTPTYMIYNVTDSQDMLSVGITIDANEYTSYTAATSPTINTSYDDVATGDILRIDKDVAGTGCKGDTIILRFQKP